MTFKEHKSKWENCEACDLYNRRKKVIFVRGTLPCDVLMIGEAPGVSEDIIGRPMVGPAGKLLDFIIGRACAKAGEPVSWAITNLVSCIPLGEDGAKTEEPEIESIDACSDKLYELAKIAKPRAIVTIGTLAEAYVDQSLIQLRKEVPLTKDRITIMHPAAILRADIAFKDLLIQRAISELSDLFEEIVIPF